MIPNNLKKLRTKKGLTQKALAEAVGTSQQQIQRIEAGQTATLSLAVALSEHLQLPPGSVFPSIKSLLRRLTSPKGQDVVSRALIKAVRDDSVSGDFLRAGFEVSPSRYFFEFLLTNGQSSLLLVSSNNKDCIERALANDVFDPKTRPAFFVFDTFRHRFALKTSELVLWRFHYDTTSLSGAPENDDDDPDPGEELCVWYAGCAKPYRIRVDDDEYEHHDTNYEGCGQLQTAFIDVGEAIDDDFCAKIVDTEGNVAVINFKHVQMFSVPLELIDPNYSADDDDDDDLDASSG